jgi:hypothetical protein
MRDPFLEHRAVLAKVDAKFVQLHQQYRDQMVCRSGCHGCCLPGLTVGRLERDFLRAHIVASPGLAGQLTALATEHPHGVTRCELLRADGSCAVYAARPLVCRSHGAPLRLPDGRVDACPLNFRAGTPTEPGDCIDVQTLDTLRFVVGRRYAPDDDGARFPLTVAELLRP